MIKTIAIASCISIQGQLIRHLTDGRIVISDGRRKFTGFPVCLINPGCR